MRDCMLFDAEKLLQENVGVLRQREYTTVTPFLRSMLRHCRFRNTDL